MSRRRLVADISSLRDLALFGYSVSAFSIAYPLTFTLRDMAHKLAGPHVARTLIIAAAVIYLIVQAFFAIIAGLPPEMTPDENVAIGQLLSLEWRFLLAAVVASVLSQLVDTEVYTRWVERFGGAHQWGRVLVSNLIGIPLDRILFLLIAFLGAWSGDEFCGGIHRHVDCAHRLRHHLDPGHLPGRGAFGRLDPYHRDPPYRPAVLRAREGRVARRFQGGCLLVPALQIWRVCRGEGRLARKRIR